MNTTSEISTERLHKLQALTKYTYAIVPIVAGIDKFTHLLTDWDKYLSPTFEAIIPFDPHTFMLIVGVIEIIAGIIVLAAFGGGFTWGAIYLKWAYDPK